MQELLQTRRKRTKGVRIVLEGHFVYSTQEVLDVVQKHENAQGVKRRRGRPRKTPIIENNEEEEIDSIEELFEGSESDLEESVAYRTRSRRLN